MPQQDLYVGLGCLLYSVAKADGYLQPEERRTIKQVLGRQAHGELALNAFKVQEALNRKPEESYGTALRRLVENRTDFDKHTRSVFLEILQQVAMAANGISDAEKDIIKRFRRDLGQI